ncbi:MAG: tRNA pseudouridine(55) synthase TruB [Bacteroidetes bacterium GWF2_41_61]|nr:MAG: tRNA pseudouridine(55) synthase TruB [Bacteroidetes bacterium GWE2_40_15]OFY27643.1 MAG: tRNA pseudouridine(55) synthase TruB [Bacteroidetes bacterium GWF2_41_61]OFY91099.1 MAG: tRNA pseudouridine(55) synthase TruB [Bacteroidetes bacterium RIFOXYA12_FULL_40_10]HBG25091.1 tRNA pseudouridine(55) synthase TruB [Rikenellaceae bacterium]HBZ24820.1 tRNA pseudouridine(55) synthase TruB [Rikenellaceae bacterium]
MEDYPAGLVIVLDKPYGWTSADAVRKIKFALQRWFGVKNIKVGHAGTLDPLATGILMICAGKATRLAESLQSQKKEYIAEITFGATTPSYDLEKEIDATFPFEHITKESVEEILPLFTGEINQIPPLFSAKLVDGNRAYDIAREGRDVQLKASKITIYNLKVLNYQSGVLELFVECSKGTYIRSLARDFGVSLKSGAHLSSLVRSASGGFKVENAISMDNLKLFLQ